MGTPSRGDAGAARALVPLYAPTIEPGNAVGECQADDNVPAMTADQAGHPRLESAAAEAHDADIKPILCLSHAGSLCSRRILPPLRSLGLPALPPHRHGLLDPIPYSDHSFSALCLAALAIDDANHAA
ncbi:hypothetical protein PANT_5c00045 [Moesziomyces antarcticus T-34]|uniref:Uncharacterized protein n=1 Tax=Pseudozyma antarctica (strain T-34) TaxID=1151754 RepID=M9LXQ3_PSEA3|nr:hypothetical protein PANT_5c00045 [Moesziomyces antarcticus T-34]